MQHVIQRNYLWRAKIPLSTTCYFQFLQEYFYNDYCYYSLGGSSLWARNERTSFSYSTISIHHSIFPFFISENSSMDGSSIDDMFYSNSTFYTSSRPISKVWGPVLAHSISGIGKIVAQYANQSDIIRQRPALYKFDNYKMLYNFI